ncbi:MAG TPA: AEC family transporter [Polyangiales bacterium]|nr:AEC family transporter [Polyangiales bacterium]
MTQALVLVLSLLALGYLANRFGRMPASASDVLNRLVIDLCLPAVLLRVIPTLRFRWDVLALIVTPWALAVVGLLVARSAQRILKLDRATATVLFLCTALGNTSFLGFPLCSALLGADSLRYAAVYDQLGSFLLLAFVAPIAIARAQGSASSFWDSARKVIAFPPFLATVVALIPWPRPDWLDPVLAQIAAAMIPVALFAVGLKLRFTPPRPYGAFAVGMLFKLVVSPGLAWGLMLLFDPPHAVFQVAIVEAAMPAMVTAGALAMAAGLAPELAAAFVGWGVVLALLSVPAWAALVK